VAGNFDRRVYWFAQRIVPKLIAGVVSPPTLAREILGPGRGEIDSMITIEGAVDQLHRLGRRGTLIYVPTHSSNLDSLALGDTLSREGLPPVVYGAGKNLFTNPIISFFMHNLGAYRVDRRVRAVVYKELLKTYSSVMIERGYHSLFFPGGTRGRSGMIERKLKLGLAGTGVEAFSRNCLRAQGNAEARRVYFVPVTINYSVVLEAETLIGDYLKETGQARYIIDDDEFSQIDRWIAFFNKLRGQESACVLRVGRPLDPFGNDVDDAGDSLAPDGRVIDPASYVSRGGEVTVDPARDAGYTRELGRVLVERFRTETVIMSPNLVAHLLFRHLVEQTPGVGLFGRMRRKGEFSCDRGALVSEIGQARDRLLELESEGRLRVSPFLRREAPERTLERALQAWTYHSRSVARAAEGRVVLEDPPLAFYYQNRMVDWAESLVRDWPESARRAAREISDMGGRHG
jgi:glycerol-3-phosphate O-acyltransferase